VHSLYSLAESLLVVAWDLLPWLWRLSGAALAFVPAPLATRLGLTPLLGSASPAAVERAQSVMLMLILSGEL
jgi:hypothetical protein